MSIGTAIRSALLAGMTVSAVAALAAEPAGARDAPAESEPSSEQIVAAVRAAAVKDAEAHPERKDSPLWGQFPAKGSAGVHAFEGDVGRASVSVSTSDDAAIEWYYAPPQGSGYPGDDAYTTDKDWGRTSKQGGTLVFGTSDKPAATDDTGYYRACVTNALGRACSDPMKVIIQSRSEDGWWGPIERGEDTFGSCAPSSDSFAQKVLIGVEGQDWYDDAAPAPRLQCGYLVDPATREIAQRTDDQSTVHVMGATDPYPGGRETDYSCPSDRPFITGLAAYSSGSWFSYEIGAANLQCVGLRTGAGEVTVDKSSYGESEGEIVTKHSCQPGGVEGGPPLPTSITATGLTWRLYRAVPFGDYRTGATRLTCTTVRFPAYQ